MNKVMTSELMIITTSTEVAVVDPFDAAQAKEKLIGSLLIEAGDKITEAYKLALELKESGEWIYLINPETGNAWKSFNKWAVSFLGVHVSYVYHRLDNNKAERDIAKVLDGGTQFKDPINGEMIEIARLDHLPVSWTDSLVDLDTPEQMAEALALSYAMRPNGDVTAKIVKTAVGKVAEMNATRGFISFKGEQHIVDAAMTEELAIEAEVDRQRIKDHMSPVAYEGYQEIVSADNGYLLLRIPQEAERAIKDQQANGQTKIYVRLTAEIK